METTPALGPSRRALRYTGPDSLADVNDIVDDDVYHPQSNPDGILNLGTTMNPLMADFVDEFLRKRFKINAKLRMKARLHLYYSDILTTYPQQSCIISPAAHPCYEPL